VIGVLALSVLVTPMFNAARGSILVIWGDDIGWSNLSCYNLGMMGYQTPTIDCDDPERGGHGEV
jgi:hypothetical protein